MMNQVGPNSDMTEWFTMPQPEEIGPLAEVFSYLSVDTIKTASSVSTSWDRFTKENTAHTLLSLAGVNTLSSNLIRRYQDRMQFAGIELTFAQAMAQCLEQKALLQRTPQEPKICRVELSDCTLTQEVINVLKEYGSDIQSLSFSRVHVPLGQHDGFAEVISSMPNLESLSIAMSDLVQTLDLSPNPRLTQLEINTCMWLQHPPIIPQRNALKAIVMNHCFSLLNPPDLTNAMLLETLDLHGCTALVDAPVIPQGSRLKTLDMKDCIALVNPPDLTNAMLLETLDLYGCIALVATLVIPKRSRLIKLNMRKCPVRALPTKIPTSSSALRIII